MNDRLIPTIATSLCLAAGLFAQAPAAPVPEPAAPSVTTTLTASYVSTYMFRGTRLGADSFQPSVEVGYGNLALGVWSNFPIKDEVPGQSDPEIDPYGSYKFVLSDAVSIQPGFTFYKYPRAEKANGYYKSTFEPNVALIYTVAGVTLTPKFYYDTVVKGATYELNGFYALPLAEIGTELDFTASVGTFKLRKAWEDTTPHMKNWGDYWSVGVAMPYQVTKNSKLTVGLAYAKGHDNFLKQGTDPKFENTAAVGRGVLSISYALSF